MDNRKQVKMPDWWTKETSACSNPSETSIGLTDGIETFLCSNEPCYFVEVPAFNYEGYFKVKDLKVIGEKDG